MKIRIFNYLEDIIMDFIAITKKMTHTQIIRSADENFLKKKDKFFGALRFTAYLYANKTITKMGPAKRFVHELLVSVFIHLFTFSHSHFHHLHHHLLLLLLLLLLLIIIIIITTTTSTTTSSPPPPPHHAVV